MSTQESGHNLSSSPRPPSSGALAFIAFLAGLYTLYFAASLLIPIAVALFISFLFNPLVNLLGRVYVPRIVSALLLLVVIGGPFTLLGVQLAEPAQRWLNELPELTAKLNEQIENISVAITPKDNETPAQDTDENGESGGFSGLFDWFGGEDDSAQSEAGASAKPATTGSTLNERLLTGGFDLLIGTLEATPVLFAQIIAMLVLIVFLVVYGPGLYRAVLDILPLDKDRRRVIDMARNAQSELSRYILTISVINVGLGLATAAALWALNFRDPLLWGTMVGLLNFAPYVGPALSTVIISTVGVIESGLAFSSLLPAAVYFFINFLEAQFVTPAALGRHMRMNPLVIILWLMIWGWLWGFAGVLVAVPLMVCVKLVIGQYPRWRPWLELIESR